MSVLAKNLRTIRRELRCTQSVMSDILKVGFRTYVRYEAGERDAPAAILVKMAKLGNISLEQLLTTEVGKHDLSPLQAISKGDRPQEIRAANFRKGQVVFKHPARQELMTVDSSEKKLLSIFRKMELPLQNVCLKDMEETLKGRPGHSRGLLRKGGRGRKPKSAKASAAQNGALKTPKKRGRPGRKKVDKKLLKEKIDKLKMITGSIHKITVR